MVLSDGSLATSVSAALWLGALWWAAPLLGPAAAPDAAPGDVDPAGRLRDAIALGVAIPFAFGALGILSFGTCAGAALVLIAFRLRLRPPRLGFAAPRPRGAASLDALIVPGVVATVVSWPALVRPLLQGDSLGYHLPNAAAWSVGHTLWTTGTWYWWYPGGSELFAAGLETAAGPLAVTFAGFVALLLLAYRLAAFARRADLPEPACAAFAAAVISIPAVALQSGTLENDVWLAAWLLEIVWALREERGASARAVGVAALVKPYGVAFAALEAALGRAPLRTIALGFAPIAFWLVRDAVLWRTATIDPAALAVHDLFGTTIVAHGVAGIATLGRALWNAGPGMLLASLALACTIACGRDPLVRIGAAGTFVFFLIEPFGFRNDAPQLATGASLRFLFPALVLGVVGVLPFVRRFALPFAAVAIALALVQTIDVVKIFANDATTHRWPLAAALVGIALAADGLRTRGVATTLVSLALVAYAVRLAASHPADYYDDLIARDGVTSHAFAWLARERPAAIVGDTIRLGSIVVVSPRTRVQNTVGGDPCAEARRAGAWLMVGDDPPTSDVAFAARRARAKACGAVRYDDGMALVVAPR